MNVCIRHVHKNFRSVETAIILQWNTRTEVCDVSSRICHVKTAMCLVNIGIYITWLLGWSCWRFPTQDRLFFSLYTLPLGKCGDACPGQQESEKIKQKSDEWLFAVKDQFGYLFCYNYAKIFTAQAKSKVHKACSVHQLMRCVKKEKIYKTQVWLFLYTISLFDIDIVHKFFDVDMVYKQENMRGQRGTLRALAVICHSHYWKLFLVCFPKRPHELQPRSEVFSEIKKANFNDIDGFVVLTHKHFSWGCKRSLFFVVYKRSLLAGYARTNKP